MSQPMSDNPPREVGDLTADGRPFVRCPCGFVAMSDSEFENRVALEEHPCPNRVVEVVEHRWYDRIFSLWGFLILFLIAYAVLAALGKATW